MYYKYVEDDDDAADKVSRRKRIGINSQIKLSSLEHLPNVNRQEQRFQH